MHLPTLFGHFDTYATVRLTNTQYEGVREYENEAVIAKWSGNPPDLGRLGRVLSSAVLEKIKPGLS